MEKENKIVMAIAIPLGASCLAGAFYNPVLGLFALGCGMIARVLWKEREARA